MKLGFIGTGNMAGAIMGGIIRNEIFKPEEIIGADISKESRSKVQSAYGINVTEDNKKAASESEVLVLSVKPQYYAETIKEIKDCVREDQLIITIAPGKTLKWLEEQFEKKVKIVRAMPNTPALVLAGATGMCFHPSVSKEERETAITIFESFGVVAEVSENMIDTVIGVSGSSPAYVFMFIEAMADAAVADGMPRAMAYELAAQTVYGSAKMVLETGKHPGELKDMVCSPAGTTIEAVRVLEEKGLRSAVIEGQMACVKKAREL